MPGEGHGGATDSANGATEAPKEMSSKTSCVLRSSPSGEGGLLTPPEERAGARQARSHMAARVDGGGSRLGDSGEWEGRSEEKCHGERGTVTRE